MTKFPSLFISHAEPNLALDDTPTSQFLKSLGENLPKPEAILIMSAHLAEDELFIENSPAYETIYDFHGFNPKLQKIKYTAKGHDGVTEKLMTLLADFNPQLMTDIGLDHGSWVPLSLMFPKVDVPVVQISVQPAKDAQYHYNLGRAVESLRDDGVLVIGSGSLTHNLREAMKPRKPAQEESWVLEFSNWIYDKLDEGDLESLLKWSELAPHAAKNHPTPEHFLPFFFALGAGGDGFGFTQLHSEIRFRVLQTDIISFE